jgi:hypothetical protein
VSLIQVLCQDKISNSVSDTVRVGDPKKVSLIQNLGDPKKVSLIQVLCQDKISNSVSDTDILVNISIGIQIVLIGIQIVLLEDCFL